MHFTSRDPSSSGQSYLSFLFTVGHILHRTGDLNWGFPIRRRVRVITTLSAPPSQVSPSCRVMFIQLSSSVRARTVWQLRRGTWQVHRKISPNASQQIRSSSSHVIQSIFFAPHIHDKLIINCNWCAWLIVLYLFDAPFCNVGCL